MPFHRVAVATVLALVATPLLAGCSSDAASDGQGWTVAASFYPLQFVTERVGGDLVDVTNLTKPGAEPHDLELAPQDLATLTDADLAVYLSGFQPAVDEAVAQLDSAQALDVADAADLSLTYEPIDHSDEDADHADHADGIVDPHFWLDPQRLADVGDEVALALSRLDPEAQQTFEENAQALRSDLEALDADFRAGLADCERRQLVTSHTAFGYLADAYDLEQVGLVGLSPDAEPSPQSLAAVTDFVIANDVATIFYETLVSPDVADTVAAATGASTAVLDPVEGLTDQSAGDDYLQVMRANLASLEEGLPCP